MPKTFNPYVTGLPVREDAFYGREKLMNIVRDALAIGTVNLLIFFGQRRIGKTSLLQNLGTHPELDDYLFIYNDAVEIVDKKSFEVLYHLGQKIAQVLDLQSPTKSQLEKDEDSFQKEFLPLVYERITKKRLVLLIDEFDIFERRRKTNRDSKNITESRSALDAIEHIITTEPNLAFVVALGRGQEKLLSDLSRITRTGHWAKVSLLEEADTRQLITEPAKDQLTYLPEAVDAILKLTAGHPYYTQLVCYEIFNELQVEGGNQVRVSDVQNAAEKSLETGTGGFNWVWEELTPAQKIVASLLAEGAEDISDHVVSETELSEEFEKNHIYRLGLELTEALNQLIDLDIIERKGPTSYRFTVELIRCWISKEHPISYEREQYLPLLNERAIAEFAKGQSAGDPDMAVRHYQEAIAANPNHIAAHLALAEILFEKRRFNEAVETYETAYWLDPAKAAEELEKAKNARATAEKQPGRRKLLRFLVAGGILIVVGAIGFLMSAGLPKPKVTLTPTLIAAINDTPTQPESTPPSLVPTLKPTVELALAPSSEPTIESLLEPTLAPTSKPSPEPTVEPITLPTLTPTQEATTELTPLPIEEPTSEPLPVPTEIPTPTLPPIVASPTPTPTETIIIYPAPILISPVSEIEFTLSDEVKLQWSSVGDLALDEQYAVRIRFLKNGQFTTDGHQVTTTEWIVPPDFRNQVDGPEFKFEWYVFVERVEKRGANTQISPNSETRVFYWR